MEAALLRSENTKMQEEKPEVLVSPLRNAEMYRIERFLIGLCWLSLHLCVGAVHLGLHIFYRIESRLISLSEMSKRKALRLKKLRHLALVVDSEGFLNISRVIKLLHWLAAIGVKHVSIYDIDGVLKKEKNMLLKKVKRSRLWEDNVEKEVMPDHQGMMLEFLSISDGKEAAAKAASFLCSEYLAGNTSAGHEKEPVVTESDMDRALKAVGCWGPDPDLLLVYGPARCHLGFPAWRIRYTEIVHMGPLKSLQYGALMKAIHKFENVEQNYGK